MKKLSNFVVVVAALVVIFSGTYSFGEENMRWKELLKSSGPVKVYVEDVVNTSNDANIDVDKVKEIVDEAFKENKNTDFVILDSSDGADIIFKGTISDYVWSQKAPLTNIFPPAALAVDEATRANKNWARMELDYKIYDAKSNSLLLDYETQVTIKRPNVPKAKSYGLIYERARQILARDMFTRADSDKKASGAKVR